MTEPRRSARQPTWGLHRRGLLRLAGLGAVTPLLASCSRRFGRKGEEHRVLVDMSVGRRFEPSAVTIARGTTVVWRNHGTTPHTATCDPADDRLAPWTRLPEGAPAWGSGDVYPGDTWEQTFETAGAYVYGCRHHVSDGMLGTVTVTE